jgi:hypothetical protein
MSGSEILKVMQSLSHVLGKSKYDGAHDDEGEPYKIGLGREEGNPILDKRVNDGFSLKFMGGDKVRICYHLDSIPLKEAHGKDFESNIEQSIADVKSFIQKEAKKTSGSPVTLQKDGEVIIEVDYISRVRCSVYAGQEFRVSQLKSASIEDSPKSIDDRLDKSFKDFLAKGGFESSKVDSKQKAPKDPQGPHGIFK